MEVSDGESVHINNVLIGEVWLCSGQSNMDMRVSGRYGDPVIGSLDAIVTSGNPEVRMFIVGSKMTSEPLTVKVFGRKLLLKQSPSSRLPDISLHAN